MFKEARELIATIREKDPAAHGAAEIIFAYPGFHAVMIHRFAHWCAIQGWTAFALQTIWTMTIKRSPDFSTLI